MKRIFPYLLLFAIYSCNSIAQNSTVSGTVGFQTDTLHPPGTWIFIETWGSAEVTAQLKGAQGNPHYIDGTPVTTRVTALAASDGTVSLTVARNDYIDQKNTQWVFTFCTPGAIYCVTSQPTTISSATLNLTVFERSTITYPMSVDLKPYGGLLVTAYSDSSIINALTGQNYVRYSDSAVRVRANNGTWYSVPFPGATSNGTNGAVFTGVVTAPNFIATSLDANAGSVCTDANKQLKTIGCSGGGGVSNTNAAFSHWNDALQNVINATGFARVCAVGDSTTEGFGGGSVGNMIVGSYPTQLSAFLTSQYGIASSVETWFGTGMNAGGAGGTPFEDTRIIVGGAWTANASFISLGGKTLKATTNTNALSFTPSIAVDTFRIFYITTPGGGTLSVNLDGGSPTTQTTNGTAALSVMTVTGTLASHTVNVTWSNGGQVDVVGMEAYNSTVPNVIVENMGSGGAKAADLASTAASWSSGQSAPYSTVGCNLVVLEDGINDWNAGVVVATYKASMQSLVTAIVAANSDVAILAPVPSQTPANAALSTQLTYINALRSLAGSNKNSGAKQAFPFIDGWTTFAGSLNGAVVGWDYANGRTWMSDGLHPNASGYNQLSVSVANAIAPIAQTQSSAPPIAIPTIPLLTITQTAVNTNALVINGSAHPTFVLHNLSGSGDANVLDQYSSGVLYNELDAYQGNYFKPAAGGNAFNTSIRPAVGITSFASNGTNAQTYIQGVDAATGAQLTWALGNECSGAYCGVLRLHLNGTEAARISSIVNYPSFVPTSFSAIQYLTPTVCSSTASPAACGANVAGKVQVAAAATTLQINSTAITANTGCWFTYDVDGITPPANIASLLAPYISAKTAGTSIMITLPVAPTTNPVNIRFGCMN